MFSNSQKLSIAPVCAAFLLLGGQASAQTAPSTQAAVIHFKAVVGKEDFACGRSYSGIGTTKSTIEP